MGDGGIVLLLVAIIHPIILIDVFPESKNTVHVTVEEIEDGVES